MEVTINDFDKMKSVGKVGVSSKKNIFIISSIYISINEELVKNEAKKLYEPEIYEKDTLEKIPALLEILKFDLIDVKNFILYINPLKFKEIFNKDIEKVSYFPFPFNISIHLRDMTKCFPNIYYEINLIADKILTNSNNNNNILINLQKANNNDIFGFDESKGTYNIHFEEDEEKNKKNFKYFLNY